MEILAGILITNDVSNVPLFEIITFHSGISQCLGLSGFNIAVFEGIILISYYISISDTSSEVSNSSWLSLKDDYF